MRLRTILTLLALMAYSVHHHRWCVLLLFHATVSLFSRPSNVPPQRTEMIKNQVAGFLNRKPETGQGTGQVSRNPSGRFENPIRITSTGAKHDPGPFQGRTGSGRLLPHGPHRQNHCLEQSIRPRQFRWPQFFFSSPISRKPSRKFPENIWLWGLPPINGGAYYSYPVYASADNPTGVVDSSRHPYGSWRRTSSRQPMVLPF